MHEIIYPASKNKMNRLSVLKIHISEVSTIYPFVSTRLARFLLNKIMWRNGKFIIPIKIKKI